MKAEVPPDAVRTIKLSQEFYSFLRLKATVEYTKLPNKKQDMEPFW